MHARHRRQTDRQTIRDLRSFAIWVESNRTIPITFDSNATADSKFSNHPHLPSYHKPRSLFNKKLQPLRRCHWDLFYVLQFYFYVARAYTLASTVTIITSFNTHLIHNSCGNRHWIRRLNDCAPWFEWMNEWMMFLLTCDKKLTKSQFSPTHASTKRKITDELKHNAGWYEVREGSPVEVQWAVGG